MEQKSEESQMAEDIITCLYRKGIRLLALDFDKTIISIHTAGMWKGGTPELAEHVRPCFKALIEAVLDHKLPDLNLCIVTYSLQPVLIRDVLKFILPNSDISRVVIRANTGDWHASQGPPFLGKQQHIAWVTTMLYNVHHLIVEPQEILLIDDDDENVEMAKDFGHQAYNVQEDVSLVTMKEFSYNLEVKQRLDNVS